MGQAESGHASRGVELAEPISDLYHMPRKVNLSSSYRWETSPLHQSNLPTDPSTRFDFASDRPRLDSRINPRDVQRSPNSHLQTPNIRYETGSHQLSGSGASSVGVFSKSRQSGPAYSTQNSGGGSEQRSLRTSSIRESAYSVPDHKLSVNKANDLIRLNQLSKKLTVDNMDDVIDSFEKEQKKLQDAVDRLKAKRSEAFQKELRDFEEEFNPFEILGIQPTQDEALIKKAYKKQSLRYHPDKGGDEYNFGLVTKAYLYITKRLEKLKIRVSDQNELRDQFKNYQSSNRQSVYVDKNNFDRKRFNEVFEQHKLDNPNDAGYGDMMETSDRSKEPDKIPTNNLFNGKFNRDLFNDMFANEKSEANTKRDVIVYDEPQALISGNLNYFELGQGQIDDFGSTESVSGVGYTDYKKAHGTDSILIDPSKIKFKTYKDIDDLKQDRSSMSYESSPEERRKLRLREARQELYEQERLMRLEEYDQKAENVHNAMTRVFLQ